MFKKIIILSMLIFSFGIKAEIVDSGTLIQDTDQGLDWLKLTETQGLTFEYISSQLGPGGEFEGWTYATGAQFEGLMLETGAEAMNSCFNLQFCGAQDSSLVQTIGAILGETGAGYTLGILADNSELMPDMHWVALVTSVVLPLHSEAGIYTYSHQQQISVTDPEVGSFLVRPSEVPIPQAGILFMSSITGLFFA